MNLHELTELLAFFVTIFAVLFTVGFIGFDKDTRKVLFIFTMAIVAMIIFFILIAMMSLV